MFQEMFLLFFFVLPLVTGAEFLFFNVRDIDQELPECIGNGILSCQRVSTIDTIPCQKVRIKMIKT
jgi:hypothetical protein